jgi:hypothetical protein
MNNFCPKYFSFQDELNSMLSKLFIGIHAKCPFFSSGFNKNLNFLD